MQFTFKPLTREDLPMRHMRSNRPLAKERARDTELSRRGIQDDRQRRHARRTRDADARGADRKMSRVFVAGDRGRSCYVAEVQTAGPPADATGYR